MLIIHFKSRSTMTNRRRKTDNVIDLKFDNRPIYSAFSGRSNANVFTARSSVQTGRKKLQHKIDFCERTFATYALVGRRRHTSGCRGLLIFIYNRKHVYTL